MTDSAEIVIVGGGHNGLTAAAYLAQAGRSVVVFERAEAVGGAAVSAAPFPGLDARLSRYSYLVSLLPARIRQDLGLRLTLSRRRYASYTPQPGTDRGLLIDTADAEATAASFHSVGAGADAAAYRRWLADTAALAAAVWPTMLEPLPPESAVRRQVDPRIWQDLVTTPVGVTLASRFASDLVRGMVGTDALIGTFAALDDPALTQNACLLYHVIGGGTGDWDVPVGGMGAVTGALEQAACRAGAAIVTGAEVTAITPDGEVTARIRGEQRVYAAGSVLANVAPAVLERLLGRPATSPEGAQIKANVLLTRLPRLKDRSVTPEAAFAGTFHVHEAASELDAAHAAAASGRLPEPLPLETYCHSLTDPTILGPQLRAAGAHTLTVFGLQAPHRLGLDRDAAQAAVLASIDSVLDEPIEDLLVRDGDGRPAIEVRTTADLETSLGMPGGHIFHGPLSLPWHPDDRPPVTAAERWGVATADPRILLCGSGSVRGGAVSGLGGYAAARAVLEG